MHDWASPVDRVMGCCTCDGERRLSVHLLLSLLSLLFQIWRLITNFLFFGPLGFSFFFNMIFLYPLVSVKLSAPFLA